VKSWRFVQEGGKVRLPCHNDPVVERYAFFHDPDRIGWVLRQSPGTFGHVRRLPVFLHLDGDVTLRVGLLVLPETHYVALRVLKVRERTHTWNRLPRADDTASAGLHFPEGVVDRVNVDRDHRRGRV
jgi:hypothetical protein